MTARPRWKFQREAARDVATFKAKAAKVGIPFRQEAPRIPNPQRPDPVALLAEATAALRLKIDELCFPEGADPFRIGYLYALRAVSGGPVKIGKAIEPAARVAEIQRMNAQPLVILGLAHHQVEEAWLHRRNRSRRLHGEWFDIDENPLPIGASCFVCEANRRRAP